MVRADSENILVSLKLKESRKGTTSGYTKKQTKRRGGKELLN